MKISLTTIALLIAVTTTPMLAEVAQNIVEFSPAPDTAGGWSYNGAGILSFDQDIVIDTALGSNYDALTGAHIYLPTFQVGGIPGTPYTLTPLGSPQITITSADNSVTYLTGTLGSGRPVHHRHSSRRLHPVPDRHHGLVRHARRLHPGLGGSGDS